VGNKTHPIGFRLGIVKDWQVKWFAAKQKDYRALVKEDIGIRNIVLGGNADASISRVEIERGANDLVVSVHTARPGIVIGRGGQRVEELRKDLEKLTGGRVRLNVQEIRQAELDAFLVARNIADQLERRIAFRRAIRQAIMRTMQAGAQGVKVIAAGRLAGGDIARTEKAMEGRVPLHTLRADIDFDIAEAATDFGRIGVKVWIFKGEILPEPKPQEADLEDMPPIEVTVRVDQEDQTEGTAEEPVTPIEPQAPAEETPAQAEPTPEADAPADAPAEPAEKKAPDAPTEES